MHLKKLFLSILFLAVINVSVAQKLSQRLLEKIVKHIELKHLNDRMVRTETDSTMKITFYEKKLGFWLSNYTIPKTNFETYQGYSIIEGDLNNDNINEKLVNVLHIFGNSRFSQVVFYYLYIDNELFSFTEREISNKECSLQAQTIRDNKVEFREEYYDKKSWEVTHSKIEKYQWNNKEFILVTSK